MDLKGAENKIGLKFNDEGLLKQAFTHRSYLNENKNTGLEHNERLEFLGDAVLELVVTDYLFAKYPKKPEGELTALRSALVNSVMLATLGTELDFNTYLLLSRGEAKDTGRARQYILANTFEAVVGAIYLDGGYDAAKDFITRSLLPKTNEIEEKRLWVDAKSYFQEKAQERVGITPAYKTLKESGPDHDKEFTVGLFLGDALIAEGAGKSKQEAEQDAARNGLEVKKW
ncbi:MAG: ribonuclease III [Candidatus Paceibacterota bacterium]|jgi:ribonuclease-3